jgi:hypothetical protein
MTAASALVAELPPNHGGYGADGIPVRDRMILDMLAAEQSPPYEWVQLVSVKGDRALRLLVGADAVKIGDESDAIRVNLCALAAQELADKHDCALLTPKLNDLVWEQSAAKLSPSNISPYPADATSAMVQHSRTIDAKLGPHFPPNMLVGNVGKGSINSTLLWAPPKPGKMAIYGWHVAKTYPGARPAATPDGGHVIQAESIKHVAPFVDYSATVRYVRREVELSTKAGSQLMDISDVALDPDLCDLVSHAGPVIMRHPGVPCPELVGGPGKPPCGCPVPPSGSPPPPKPKAGPVEAVPPLALVVGGVAFASAVAYFATR